MGPEIVLARPDSSQSASIEELIVPEVAFVNPAMHVRREGSDINSPLEITTNMDALYLCGCELPSETWRMPRYTGIPLIGIHRLSKLEQHIFMQRNGIQCPDFYYVGRNGPAIADVLRYLPLSAELVIKGPYGARGSHQLLMTKGDLLSHKVLKKLEESERKVRRKEAPTDDSEIIQVEQLTDPALRNVSVGGPLEYASHSLRVIRDEDKLITRRQDLAEEWRILCFANDGNSLVFRRHLPEDHFQANLAVGARVEYLGIQMPEHIRNSVDFFRKVILAGFPTIPWFSLDVYVTKTNEIGIFEFSQEFGFDACPDPYIIKSKALNALRYLLPKDKLSGSYT